MSKKICPLCGDYAHKSAGPVLDEQHREGGDYAGLCIAVQEGARDQLSAEAVKEKVALGLSDDQLRALYWFRGLKYRLIHVLWKVTGHKS